MGNDMAERDEMLVLADEDGNYYAIPRETVERYRLSGEQKAKLEELLGDDVSGYMQNYYMMEKTAGYNHAELLQKAARERQARQATEAQKGSEPKLDTGEASLAGTSGRIRGRLFGRFVSMLRSPRTQTA